MYIICISPSLNVFFLLVFCYWVVVIKSSCLSLLLSFAFVFCFFFCVPPGNKTDQLISFSKILLCTYKNNQNVRILLHFGTQTMYMQPWLHAATNIMFTLQVNIRTWVIFFWLLNITYSVSEWLKATFLMTFLFIWAHFWTVSPAIWIEIYTHYWLNVS